MAFLLGIDIGTSGTKALVCDTKGKVLATATSEHDIASPKPGWSEQDPKQWWSAVCLATRAVLKKAKVSAAACKGIGLSGQMHGSVFLDDAGHETGEPLRPALLWNDQRTAAQCAEIEKKAGGRTKLIDMVGNPALTGFTAPKILWVRQHEPAVFEKTKHILLPKDYIRFRMTGEYATEVSDAAGMLLLDVRKRQWHTGLMSKLGLDKKLFAHCVESHIVTGKLTKWAAEALGLKAGVPVVGGAGDNAAGAVGNGIVRHGVAMASLGTSGVVFAHADKPVLDPKGRVHTMCSAVEGKWCVFGCMLSAGGSLQWFRNHMAKDETARAKRKGVDVYELLMSEAAAAAPGSEGLVFLPYLTGERCPHPDPLARGGWIGLTARHNRAAMIRSVIEGITFGMTDALRIMQNMGIDIQTICLTGGGSRSPFWRQMQADIYNVPVALTNSQEGAAYGVALLAGVGTGVWKSVPQAAAAIIKETERRTPDADSAKFYAKAHRVYDGLYPTLKTTFPKLAKLV
ncbi:MAG: xylulokinase [Planctomycetes bacterium]|nr:xylulokinase [Planctomycetota bacterium]